jgi:hypothetical protein
MCAFFAAAVLAAISFSVSAAETKPYVWWEGEAPTETNFPKDSSFGSSTFRDKKDEILSGGDWLTNEGKRAAGAPEAFAKYKVNVPAAGKYEFWSRKFWKHGPFRWRFDQNEWKECGKDIALADSAGIRQHLGANWVFLGNVELSAGDHEFELRLLAKEGEGLTACFDCFLLSPQPFTPRGKLKPGEKSGKADPGWWAFEPDADPFADSAIDMRHLNEKVAGESGFVRRDGANLVLGNGKPVKFWMVQSGGVDLDPDGLDYYAHRLAKAGVNLVRIESGIYDKANPEKIDTVSLDRLHRFVAAMKKHGIYTYLGHVFWATAPVKGFNIPGVEDGSAAALLEFDERLRTLYKSWARALLTTKNPYTGLAFGEDPAVAFYEIQNEDSLFFWTVSKLKGGAKERFEKIFGDFLIRKHGSLDKAAEAWGGVKLPDDAPAAGRMAMLHLWNLTTDGLEKQPANRKRAADQMQFFTETQKNSYDDLVKYIRTELKAKNAVSCSNWKTADERLMGALEHYTYTAGDVICVNDYFGPEYVTDKQRFYAIDKGDVYNDRLGMLEPQNLPIQLNNMDGYPHMVTEQNWDRPNRFRAEFPFHVATYGSLQGMDGWNFFAIGGSQWDSSSTVWSVACPSILGQFPALSLMYRRGDVKEGDTVLFDALNLEEQYAFKGSAAKKAQDFDAIHKKNVPAGGMLVGEDVSGVDPLSFYTGRIVRGFTDKSKAVTKDLSQLIDREKKTIKSVTGELFWDYGKGYSTVNTPRAQGVCGSLAKAGRIELGDVIIESSNEYGVIVAVSLDNQPLASAKKILIQACTEDVLHGWKTEPCTVDPKDQKQKGGKKPTEPKAGLKIVSTGGYPLNVKNIAATVTIKKAAGRKNVEVLDPNGYARGVKPAVETSDSMKITLPADSLYVIVY